MKIIDAAQNKPIELIKNKIIKKRDYQDLLKIVRKNRPDLSIEEISYMFNKINKTGCSCATLANNIGKIFLGKEDEFEKYFGYSLYSSNGNIDYNRILVDLFSKFYGVAKVRLIKHDVFSFKSAKEAAEKLLGEKFDKESDATLKLFEQGYQGDGFDSDGNLLFKKRIPDVSEIIGTKNEISKKLLNIDSVKDFDELKHLLTIKGYILEYKDLEIHEKLTGLTITNFNFWTNYYFNSYNLDFTLNATSIVPKDFSNYEDFINYINNLICKGNLINVSVGPNKEVYIHTDKPFSWTKISNERAGHIMNFLGFDKEGNIKVSTYGETYVIPKEYASLLEFSKVEKKDKNIVFDNKVKSKGKDNMEKELIELSAAKVHEDWCYQELKAFFDRMQDIIKKGVTRPIEIFEKACYKGDTKRNEVEIDTSFMMGHETMAQQSLTDFNTFMNLFKIGVINVKRFAKRNLTKEDQERLKVSNDYKDGNENILRSFEKLSNDSRKENLNAAQGAYNVYVELSKAGITPDEMQNNPDINNIIGIAIHADWLKRNKEHPNDALKVPYSQLDELTQNQDITVFNALLKTVKENGYKFLINKEEGYELPDYEQMEKDVLGISL